MILKLMTIFMWLITEFIIIVNIEKRQFLVRKQKVYYYISIMYFFKWQHFSKQVYIIIYAYISTGFEPGCAISPIPHCNWNYPLKKTAKGTIFSPLKFWEKTQKEAHTKSFISVQKLQAKTEHGKYNIILSIR